MPDDGPARTRADGQGGRIIPTTTLQTAGQTVDQLTVLEEGTPDYQYARNTLVEDFRALAPLIAELGERDR